MDLGDRCGEIVKLENGDKFLQSYYAVCKTAGIPAACDFLEVFDSDPPEYEAMEQDSSGTVRVTAGMGYGLSVWNGEKQLGKITAYALGTYTFLLTERTSGAPVDITAPPEEDGLSYEISRFALIELHNAEEYYDDYTAISS